jgi:adenine-specific DNA-methyltransferase
MDDSVEAFLIHHKKELLKGRKDKPDLDWVHFGRTQAINDVYKNKLAVNTLVKDNNSVKVNYVESGKGVYSGLYIMGNDCRVDITVLTALLTEKRFTDYVALLKNYKSGGYYSFSSNDLECYLNYRLSLIKEPKIIYIG